MRLLITSAGSGVAHAVREAAALSCCEWEIGATSSLSSDVDDGAIAVPTTADESFAPCFLEVVADTKPDVVLAGRDHDAFVLSQLQPDIEALGGRLLTGDTASLEASFDKARTAEHFGPPLAAIPSSSVRIAETALTLEGGQEVLRKFGRAVVKPRTGCASRGVRKVRRVDQLLQAFDPGITIVQEPLTSPARDRRHWDSLVRHGAAGERSYQLVIGRSGGLIDWWASVNVLVDGRPVFVDRISDDLTSLHAEHLSRMFASLGAWGLWNVQGKLVGDQLVIFEINGRCTGITGVRARASFNELDLGASVVGLIQDPPGAKAEPATFDCRENPHGTPFRDSAPRESRGR